MGYSLSDPIMRYIVDALAADQGSDSSKKTSIFTDYKDEKDKEEKKYQWDGRGVTPILYDSSKDHEYLHQTLQDWGAFYEKGLEGKKELIQKHCHKKPEEIEKHLKGQILWALMDKSGEVFKEFSELVQPPPFEWGEEFRKDPEIKQYLHLLFGRKGWSNIFIGAGRVEEDKIVEHISYYFVRHVENIKLFHMILEAEKFGGFLLYGIESKLLDQLYALEQDDSSAKKKEELNRLIFSGSSRASSLDENMTKIKELADALEKPKETKDQQMLTLWRLYFLGKIYKENMDLEGCLKVGCWYERFKEGNGILTSLLREELYSLLEPKVKVSLNE